MAKVLDASVGFLLHEVDLLMADLLHTLFQPQELTAEQWKVLGRLTEADGLTQRELARRSARDPTTLVRVLDRMERHGLVERRDHPSDRRVFHVVLTEKGRRRHAELAPLAVRASGMATRGMSAEDVATLVQLLRRVHANLAALRSEGLEAAAAPPPRDGAGAA